LDDARQKYDSALRTADALTSTDPELIAIEAANGRITAEPVWAKRSSPHYDASAMDGITVRSVETAGATETAPLQLSMPAQARWVDTGDAMPDGFDAVVMIENVHEVSDSLVEIQASVAPYQHVRPLGEDIVATELVLPAGHKLRPQDLAACAAAGVGEVAVRQPPRVTIIPTGNELVPIGSDLRPGDIPEFNSVMLAAMVEDWGAQPERIAPLADELSTIKAAVTTAIADSDIVIVNAGSSAGREDFTATMVRELGELVVHGVAIRPGHPVVLGIVEGKPVIGIPGYPVSAALTMELFVKPLIERLMGAVPDNRHTISATVTRKITSPIGEDEFLRVRLGKVGDKIVASPIQRGAGVIMSLVRADGIAKVPRFSEGVEAGTEVNVELVRSSDSIDKTIVAIGSHDVVLDLIASELTKLDPGLRFASTNVGSLGGLVSLSRGEAHVAGCHLLDEDTGEYNIPFVRRHLRTRDVVLVNLVHRIQGLIVPPGNPKAITTLADLGRDDVRYVNRQRGSGTRILLDYKLRELDLGPSTIQGYEREEYTHLAVAAAVAGGRADAGMGVLSAARALGMDFVPLDTERYDLVFLREYYDTELTAPLLQLIRSDHFRTQVSELGGYDVSTMGDAVAEIAGESV